MLRYMNARDLSVSLTPRYRAYTHSIAGSLSDRELETVARQALNEVANIKHEADRNEARVIRCASPCLEMP
jgi:hypothetical protein